jgi:cobalt-zinc-cadmium efflux system outer membrane protein
MRFSRALAHSSCVVLALFWSVPSGAEPVRSLTLSQALQRAVAANPRLAVAEREIGVATGRRIQAGAFPNPELSADVEDIAGSGPYRGTRSAQTTLSLGQLIEFPGKRDARIASASADLDAVRWQRQAERLDVLSETAIAFVNVLGSQRRIQIYDGLIGSLEGIGPLLQRRVEAGASSQAETGRAQVAADLIRADRERTKTALATARRELAVLMGTTVPDFGAVTGDLSAVGRTPAFAALLHGLDDHPQLVRWTAVRASRKSDLLSARLKPLPDLRVAVGWRHFNETRDNAMVVGLSAQLPLWDQNQGNILSAQETLAKADAERAVNRSVLVVLLGRAYDAMDGAQRELAILRTSAVPKAREAVRALETGYAQGRYSLIELLDTQSAFAQAVIREQEALVAYHTAVATIEWLTGAPLNPLRARTR